MEHSDEGGSKQKIAYYYYIMMFFDVKHLDYIISGPTKKAVHDPFKSREMKACVSNI